MTELKNLITGTVTEHNSVAAAKSAANLRRIKNPEFNKWAITSRNQTLQSQIDSRLSPQGKPRMTWQ